MITLMTFLEEKYCVRIFLFYIFFSLICNTLMFIITSISLYLCISLYLSFFIALHISLSIYLLLFIYLHLSLFLYISISLYLFIYISISFSISLYSSISFILSLALFFFSIHNKVTNYTQAPLYYSVLHVDVQTSSCQSLSR